MKPESKESLRQQMRERRSSLAPEFREEAGAQIAGRLRSREEFRSSQNTALYWALPGEVPTQGLIGDLLQAGRKVFLPRLGGPALEFAEVSQEADLIPGNYGIREPEGAIPSVPINQLDLILMPGLAFDGHGHRLGWGKGYYDRTLNGYTGRRWALAFDFQIFDEIPADDRDEGVDWVFTERRSIDCRNARIGREAT